MSEPINTPFGQSCGTGSSWRRNAISAKWRLSPASLIWIPRNGAKLGDYIEECKRRGERGSANDGGFTYRELCERVFDFRGEQS